ncbi:hypothetical protein ACFX15_042607 [Malus domestica]
MRIGVYRTEVGLVIRKYLLITGMADSNRLSAALVLGADSPAIKESRVTTVHCLSGSRSLRIGATRCCDEHTD